MVPRERTPVPAAREAKLLPSDIRTANNDCKVFGENQQGGENGRGFKNYLSSRRKQDTIDPAISDSIKLAALSGSNHEILPDRCQ
jgi:hypothetical protein